jgi:hypothetical protein
MSVIRFECFESLKRCQGSNWIWGPWCGAEETCLEIETLATFCTQSD